ncbi:MAG: tetratricopeptide repeat protein [Bacteroidales bacterium]
MARISKYFPILLLCLLILTNISNSFSQINTIAVLQSEEYLLQKQKYSEALVNLNNAVIRNPKDFRTLYLRGYAKFFLKDYDGAEKDFTKTLEIAPAFTNALLYRGKTYAVKKKYDLALNDFKTGLKYDPHNTQLLFDLGNIYLSKKEYHISIQKYDSVLLIQPKFIEANINKAIAYFSLNKIEKALKSINLVLKANPLNAEALWRRSLLHMKKKDLKRAQCDIEKSLKINSSNPRIYFLRGLLNIELEKPEEALKDFNIVLKMDPQNALTFFNRAILKLKSNKQKDALLDLDNVLIINPNNIRTLYLKGVTLSDLKKYKKAEETLSKAIELYPLFADGYEARSFVRAKTKNIIGAETDKQTAIEIRKKSMSPDKLKKLLGNNYYKIINRENYERIVTLDSDFENQEIQNMGFKNLNYKNQLIPIYLVKLQTQDKKLYNSELEDINNKLPKNLQLEITYFDNNKVKEQNIDTILKQSQTAIQNIKDKKTKTNLSFLLSGIINMELENWEIAKNEFKKLDSTSSLSLFSQLNIAYINFMEANNQYNKTQKNLIQPDRLSNPFDKEINVDYTDIFNTYLQLSDKYKDIPFLYFNLGNTENQRKNFHKAIDFYSKAIKLEPQFGEAYYNRALSLIVVNEIKLALADLSKAGELGIKEAFVLINRYNKNL